MLAACGAMPSFTDTFADNGYGVEASPRLAYNSEMPRGGGRYLLGEPYRIAGRTYVPRDNPDYAAVGYASWYGRDFHGRRTANGEVYDMGELTAAHPTLPLPSYVRVTNLANGRSVVVRVNDRGPYAHDRIIDVSASVAEMLDFKRKGTTKVRLQYIGPAKLDGSDRRMLMASYRGPGRAVDDSPFGARSVTPPVAVAAGAVAPRKGRILVDFGIADPAAPTSTDGDGLGPLIMRTGFASSYAATPLPTPAQSAAADLAAAGRVPARVVQLGTFGDPDNAARAEGTFQRYGRVIRSASGNLVTIKVAISDPAISTEAVLSAAENAGLSGAFLVH
ncbi:MAG TPA: septal ring lytic transglycosylase RlpA family protein [Bauldia sp.]|nr:septal ring lytic transglycosylase RlpA family protein [Bauldia sp.]